MGVQISLRGPDLSSVVVCMYTYILIAGSYSSSTVNFLKKFCTAFHSSYTILHAHVVYKSSLFSTLSPTCVIWYVCACDMLTCVSHSSFLNIFLIKLFLNLLCTRDLISFTRDQTRVLCAGSTES